MTFGEFAVSLLLGIFSVLLPIVIFMLTVAACVYIARRWVDRTGRTR